MIYEQFLQLMEGSVINEISRYLADKAKKGGLNAPEQVGLLHVMRASGATNDSLKKDFMNQKIAAHIKGKNGSMSASGKRHGYNARLIGDWIKPNGKKTTNVDKIISLRSGKTAWGDFGAKEASPVRLLQQRRNIRRNSIGKK